MLVVQVLERGSMHVLIVIGEGLSKAVRERLGAQPKALVQCSQGGLTDGLGALLRIVLHPTAVTREYE